MGLDAPFAGTNETGGVDWSQNADLKGLTSLQVFQKVVAHAGKIGLKVIFDHHTNEGSGGQQPNGLWIDKGPGTDGTDGAGVQGTVDAARFQADWVRFAKTFAGNSTVVGFDLDNEPLAQRATWGGGGPGDIHQMYTDVGNAIQAVNPGALIIAEGLITATGNGYPQLLTGAKDNPVVLGTPNKVVYSVHDYPAEIGGQAGDCVRPGRHPGDDGSLGVPRNAEHRAGLDRRDGVQHDVGRKPGLGQDAARLYERQGWGTGRSDVQRERAADQRVMVEHRRRGRRGQSGRKPERLGHFGNLQTGTAGRHRPDAVQAVLIDRRLGPAWGLSDVNVVMTEPL